MPSCVCAGTCACSADPPCAAEALSALARLQQQHQLTPSPELIQLLLHVSTRRVEEAFVRDLRRTGQVRGCLWAVPGSKRWA